MAHSQVRPVPAPAPVLAKMSYSKIAAMPAPNTHTLQNNTRIEVRNHSFSGPRIPTLTSKLPEIEQREISPVQSVQMPEGHLSFPLGKLSLVDAPIDITFSEQNGDSGDSFEEDRSQVSSSSLNKPHSFDTKSLASVTTFAMDDKESIRPDDSASVRAVDDDHPLPGLSRNSSFQHDMDQTSHRPLSRLPISNVTIPGRRFPTLINPPKFGNFGSLPISPVLECQDLTSQEPPIPTLSANGPSDVIAAPGMPLDEKLIDALTSVKDRLPLLQLEEKILYFIHSTTSDVLELPPLNGFARLLTHRLADYYGLGHQNTEDKASVRVLKLGPHGLPTPLSQLAKVMPVGSGSGPNSTAMRIMRREQLGGRQFSAGNSTAPSSSVPSKATSENGHDGSMEDGLVSPTESTPSRDKSKLTREEREAQYKVVRDRIFGDTQESTSSEIVSNGDNSGDMSRSSSSSGKKKSRKHKQPKDDSFEARSAFVQSYTPLQSHYNNVYAESHMANGYPTSPGSFDPSMYGSTPTQNYPGFDGGMGYGNMQPYNPNMMQQYSPGDWQTIQAAQNGYYMYPQAPYQTGPNVMMPHNPMMQAQMNDWYAAQFTHTVPNVPPMSQAPHFPQHTVADSRSAAPNDQFGRGFHRPHSASSIHHSHQGGKNNKSLFNPQTRSFVPSNGEGRSGQRGGRQQKQGRNSLSSFGTTDGGNTNSGQNRQEDSLKSRYGTPPSLPKKPPPSEVKQSAETIASPVSVVSGPAMQAVSSAQGDKESASHMINGGPESR